MKNIRYVKIIETHQTDEPTSIEKKVKFVLKGELFQYCDSIEEIRDKWFELRNGEQVIDFIEIYTYKNKNDLKACKQYEGVAE